MDCNTFTGSNTIQYYLDEVADTSCSCVTRLGCYSFNYQTGCNSPSECPGGGLVSRGFDAWRHNLGLPDNNDDGLPDGSGTIDSTRIALRTLMFGDTLRTILQARVDTTAIDSIWLNGSGTQSITPGTRFSAISGTLTIYDSSASAVYNCPLTVPAPVTAGNARSWTYGISVSDIAAFVPPGFAYETGDSLVFESYYRVSSNPGNYFASLDVDNNFVLTSVNHTSTCGTPSSSINLSGYYFTGCCLNEWEVEGCNNRRVSENYYLSIGNCCSNYAGGNMFPYEYRHWAHLLQSRVIIPPGYEYVASDFRFVRTRGTAATQSTTVPITPVNISNDTIYFDANAQFQVNGGPMPHG